MFKLSDQNSTIVGCNHDAWVTEPQLKFSTEGYGAAFTGATRYNGKIAPQSGMNRYGLVFTTLSIYPPSKVKPFRGKPILDRTQFLESVLQECKTLEEVESYFSKYNRSIFIRDLFVYIDTLGRVLFVEPYCIHYCTEPTVVQSNFCPSETPNKDVIRQKRFIRGNAFINAGYKVENQFARSMIETMTVCRKRHGDGTLISTIWDNRNLTFDVIFYHNFDSIRSFNLLAELQKGSITTNLEQLFARNQEFERLKSYRTPFNMLFLRYSIAISGGVLGLFGAWFLIQFFRLRGRQKRFFWIFQSIVAILGTGYCFILATDIAMFYYDWPYIHPQSWWRTSLGFVPVITTLTLILNVKNIGRILHEKYYSLVSVSTLYLLMLFGFLYWSF